MIETINAETGEVTRTPFDPSRYLTKVKGSDYLECKYRLMWLRDVHPDARITTTLVTHTSSVAVVRAEVELPTGGMASGYGQCEASEFGDYLEKAETKAVGRALAALGFGTQFAAELNDAPISDAPVQRGGPQPTALFGNGPAPRQASNTTPGTASEKQVSVIYGKAKALGWDHDRLFDAIGRHFDVAGPVKPEELSSRDASTVIDALQAKLQGGAR